MPVQPEEPTCKHRGDAEAPEDGSSRAPGTPRDVAAEVEDESSNPAGMPPLQSAPADATLSCATSALAVELRLNGEFRGETPTRVAALKVEGVSVLPGIASAARPELEPRADLVALEVAPPPRQAVAE